MNIINKITSLFFVLTISVCLSAPVWASKADIMLDNADKAVSAARNAESSADKIEKYKKATDLYTTASKDYSGTPQAANAMYQLASLQSDPDNVDGYDLMAARNTVKQLLNTYDKSAKALGEKLDQREVAEVLRIADNAKGLKTKILIALDKENSHKPLYKIIDSLVALTGRKPNFSYWFAIILLTVIIKIATAPLTNAQFKSMKEMQTIAPLIKEIQEKHKGDQKTIGEKTMALYKEHNINPFASCLPLLVQMPIILMLFYTIQQYEYQLAKGTFLWIGSGLSHLKSIHVPGFLGTIGGDVWLTAKSLAEPDLILVVLYLVSMYFSTRMSSMDPSQAEQQKMMAIMMPLMFGFIFATYPSAFLLYWLVLNILQTGQQYMIMHRPAAAVVDVPADAPKPGEGGESGRPGRRGR